MYMKNAITIPGFVFLCRKFAPKLSIKNSNLKTYFGTCMRQVELPYDIVIAIKVYRSRHYRPGRCLGIFDGQGRFSRDRRYPWHLKS